MSDSTPDVIGDEDEIEGMIALVREDWSVANVRRYNERAYSLMSSLADRLESLSARVTQAETEVADRCAHIVRTAETTSGAMGWYEQKALADAANRIDAAFAQPAPGTGNDQKGTE